MNEEWRDVVGYEGMYQVSNFGQVRSIDRISEGKPGTMCRRKGRILKLNPNARKGYLLCSVIKHGVPSSKHVHRLVAEAFIPNPDNKPVIDHIDRNRANNVVSNLRWASHSQNQQNREENTLDELYIRQIFTVSGTKDGAVFRRTFVRLEDAKAYRREVWGI
jgi:hypothetical protein